MAKIGSYPIQSTIIGTDKVIGTDVLNSGATKNFTFNDSLLGGGDLFA